MNASTALTDAPITVRVTESGHSLLKTNLTSDDRLQSTLLGALDNLVAVDAGAGAPSPLAVDAGWVWADCC